MKNFKHSIKSFLSVIICTFIFSFAFGENTDSLVLLINETDEDKTKVDLFVKLVHQYMYTDFEKAKEYADTAYHLAQEIDYPFGEARSIYYQAQI